MTQPTPRTDNQIFFWVCIYNLPFICVYAYLEEVNKLTTTLFSRCPSWLVLYIFICFWSVVIVVLIVYRENDIPLQRVLWWTAISSLIPSLGWLMNAKVSGTRFSPTELQLVVYAGLAGTWSGLNLYWWTNSNWERGVRRGTKTVTRQQLQSHLKQAQARLNRKMGTTTKKPLLVLAEVELPNFLENKGIALVGAPGSGKSQSIHQLLEILRRRSDIRVFILDRGGVFTSCHFRKGDQIFNPADRRSAHWCHTHEMGVNRLGPESLADSLVSIRPGDQPFFPGAARSLLADLFELTQDNQELWSLITLPLNQLQARLQGRASANAIAAEEQGAGVLQTLQNNFRFYRYLANLPQLPLDDPKSLSFFDWGYNDDPRWIWMPVRSQEEALFKPLNTLLFDLMFQGLLANRHHKMKTVIVIDELYSLGKLENLGRICTESRQPGGLPILGFQSTAQVEELYGRTGLRTILTGIRTQLNLSCPEPDTARYLAEWIGKQERVDETQSRTQARSTSHSTSETIRETYAVLPSQLQNLVAEKGEGYLNIVGFSPALSRVRFRDFPARIRPFIPRDGL